MASNLNSSKPWLDDRVSISLHLARPWQQDKYLKKQSLPKANPDRAWASIYEDDGSCVDIHEISPGDDCHLHVIRTDRDHFTVTDGEATIGATTTRDLVSALQLHRLIAVKKYTIRYTPFGPPCDRLIIVLHTIECLGDFFFNSTALQPLAECEHVAPALQELRETRALNDRQCFLSATAPAEYTTTRRGDREVMDEDDTPDTQQAFSTQVAHTSATRRSATNRNGSVTAGFAQRAGLPTAADSSDAVTQAKLLSLLGNSLKTGPTAAVARNAALSTTTNTNQSNAVSSRTINTPIENHPFRDRHQLNKPLFDSSKENDLEDPEPEWLGRRPVNRTAKMSEKQSSLLNQKHSWHKPLPGYRFPEGNVPIEILNAMVATHQASVESSTESSTEPTQEELPDTGLISSQASQVSWSATPEMRSLERPPILDATALPPDSSFEQRNMSANVIEGSGVLHRELQPILVDLSKSSNEQSSGEFRSSPPPSIPNNDSDDEMELDVPLGLGEDAYASPPKPTRREAVVQVKETPYTKAPQKHLPSRSPKDSSSGSIVFDTYNETTSPGERRAVEARANMPPPSLYPVETNGMVKGDIPSKHRINTLTSVPVDNVSLVDALVAQDQHDYTESVENDRDLYCAPPKRNSHDKHPFAPLQTDIQVTAAKGMPLIVQPEQISNSAQRPLPERITSGEKLPKNTKLFDTTHTKAVEPSQPHPSRRYKSLSKRELQTSPSERGSRPSMEREHKRQRKSISDRAAEMCQEKKKYFDELKKSEARRSESATTKPAEDDTNRIPLRDSNAGAEELRAPRTGSHQRPKIERSRPREALENESSVGSKMFERVDVNNQNAQQSFDSNDKDKSTRSPYQHSVSSVRHGGSLSSREDLAARTFQQASRPPTVLSPDPTSIDQAQSPASAFIFQQFKTAYPTYTGNEKQFLSMCKELKELEQEGKMVPKSQWDDYIICNKTDYVPYVHQRLDNGEISEPYYWFYNRTFEDRRYKERIVDTTHTLLAICEELEGPGPSIPSFDGPSSATKPARKSHILPEEPFIEYKKAKVADLTRTSLATGSNRSSTAPVIPHKRPSLPAANLRGLKASRSSFQGSTSRDAPAPAPGDAYRDFMIANPRIKSITGDAQVDDTKPWPENLLVRRAAGVVRKKGWYDVLKWGDVL